VVDVLGLILAVAVTGANVQDRDGGQLVLKGLKDRFPRLARVWADGVYAGRLVEWAEKTAQFVLDIVCKPRGQIGFSVLPWRWIVERTFAWLGNYPSPRSGLRDQSAHERGLDQNRHDPHYGTKARRSILRQVLSGCPVVAWPVNPNVNWQGLERWLGCLYRSRTASGENALLLTIYSLAIGCHSKLVKTGG
jgi:transposase